MSRSVKGPPASMPATRRVATPCLGARVPSLLVYEQSPRRSTPQAKPPAARRQEATSQHLAGIENAVGIEGPLDGPHQLQFDATFDARQRLALHDADAVLARNRTAKGSYRLVDRVLQGLHQREE